MRIIHKLSATLLMTAFAASAFGADPKLFPVTDFGAKNDGTTLNTDAIQKAIDACTAAGGGVVQFAKGSYLSGTIQLKGNVTLRLDEGATLLGSTDAKDYRNVDPFTAGDGYELGHAFIVAMDVKHVGIEGSGTIDGHGKEIKARQGDKPLKSLIRPFLIRWIRCAEVTVKNVHLTGAGAWTVHFFQTDNVVVDRVTIRSRGLFNNDGIDVDSCKNVRISNCDIDTGDDAICLKATSAKACDDIAATECTLKTSCNAIKLGTESLGDFTNIRITNCRLRDIGMSGIALYSVDGAHLTNVQIRDIDMDGVTVPISIRLGARLRTFRAGDIKKTPGVLRDVTIENVRAKRVKQIGLLINGIPGHPIEALNIANVQIEVPGGGTAEDAKVQLAENEATYPEYKMFGTVMPSYGMYIRHARGVSLKDVKITATKPDARPEKVYVDVEEAKSPTP